MSSRSDANASVDLEVRRDDLAATRLVDGPEPEPGEGEVLLRVDRFGLSTNNVTFGVTGEMLGYWKLFPAVDAAWGRVPVFGHADVVRSRHPEVTEGARVFGYLPMSRHLLVQPARADSRGFLDGSAHRRDVMATVWNHYQHVSATDVSASEEARRALLRPLFVTGFLIADFLDGHEVFGADVVIVSSASSKTAIATAHCLSEHRGCRVVGLTSPAHLDFVATLGVYDEVLPYPDARSVAGDRAVFVDIAGRLDARDAVHERFGDRLAHSMTVGMSNVPDAARILEPPPAQGPAPEMFYAQLQVAERAAQEGQVAFDRRLEEGWDRFTAFTGTWLTIRTGAGPAGVAAAWRSLLEGDVDPASGWDLTMWDD